MESWRVGELDSCVVGWTGPYLLGCAQGAQGKLVCVQWTAVCLGNALQVATALTKGKALYTWTPPGKPELSITPGWLAKFMVIYGAA